LRQSGGCSNQPVRVTGAERERVREYRNVAKETDSAEEFGELFHEISFNIRIIGDNSTVFVQQNEKILNLCVESYIRWQGVHSNHPLTAIRQE